MAQDKIFDNRRKLWEDRKNVGKSGASENETEVQNTRLTREFAEETTGKVIKQESAIATDSDVNETNSEILYKSYLFDDKLNELVGKITICNQCGHTKLQPVLMDSQTILQVKYCVKCENVVGVDDTYSIHDVHAMLKKLKAQLCKNCDNVDIFNYTIDRQGAECENKYVIRCHKCGNVVYEYYNDSEVLDTASEVKDDAPKSTLYNWYDWIIKTPLVKAFGVKTEQMHDVKHYVKQAARIHHLSNEIPADSYLKLSPHVLAQLVVLTGIEICGAASEMRHNKQKLEDNEISNTQYKEMQGRRLGRAAGVAGGAMAGALAMGPVGSMLGFAVGGGLAATTLIIYTSKLGGMVGQTLGDLIVKSITKKSTTVQSQDSTKGKFTGN